MLSIGKVTAHNRDYHERQVAQGRDDYYAGHGEAPGRWAGRVARELGLAGELDREGHAALVDARDPNTGEALLERGANSTVLAYDLTFSAPKSVSVLYAVADDEVSGALIDAHEAAAAAALGHLERCACQVRRGHGGHERQDADGFLGAAYRHRMSRARDPQLHTHFVVCNAARGTDGRSVVCPRRPASIRPRQGGRLPLRGPATRRGPRAPAVGRVGPRPQGDRGPQRRPRRDPQPFQPAPPGHRGIPRQARSQRAPIRREGRARDARGQAGRCRHAELAR